MSTRSLRFGMVGIVLSASMVVPAFAGAQQTSTPGTPPRPSQTVTLLRGGTVGELFAVYIPRSESAIQNSIDFARSLSLAASNDLTEARRLAIDAEGRLRILNEEIRTSKTRRDVAKKTKNEGQRLELDIAVKQQDRERNYLETLKASLKTNVERLESDRIAADAYVKALEIELTVARKNAEIGTAPTPAETAAYRDILRIMLDAQRVAAEDWVSAGELRKRTAEHQIKQVQTLDKLNNGK
jgi:hypothetical protein